MLERDLRLKAKGLTRVFAGILLWLAFGYASIMAQEGGDYDFTIPPEPSYVWSMGWSPDGNQIAVGAGPSTCNLPQNDYRIQIVDAESRTVIEHLGDLAYRCPVNSLEWSPDGSRLIGSAEGSGVEVWNILTGTSPNQFNSVTEQGFIDNLWSPDGNRIASIQRFYRNVIIWSPTTWQTLLEVDADSPASLTWNPDGTRLATTSIGDVNGGITIWDVADGQKIANYPGIAGGISWSPDGTHIAGIGENNAVQVWDALNGAILLTLSEHTDYVSQVSWHPEGEALVSASEDGTLRIWDTNTGEQLGIFEYPGPVYALDWSPDGTQLAYGGASASGEATLEIVTVSSDQIREE